MEINRIISSEDVAQRAEMDKISVLTNSYKFLLEHVLILSYPGSYRLLVIHLGRLLTDLSYRSFKGARIAFTRLYGQRRWREDVEPEWSELYDPVTEYLDLRTNRIER